MTSDASSDTRPQVGVSARAFHWLAEHRHRFDPRTASTTPRELFARKAFLELALIVGLASRRPERVPADAYAPLVEFVTSVASRRSYKELAARDRSSLLLYAATYGALRLLGHDDPEFRRSLEQLCGGRYATAVERFPYSQLDLLNTLAAAGIEHESSAVEDALARSFIAADPTVVDTRDEDVYALTHALFFATDFGLRPAPWPARHDVARTIELVDALLMLYRLRRHADLVGELICSHCCLGVHETPELARAWEHLAAVQRPDGSIPGPAGIQIPDLDDDDPAAEAWMKSYHTTLVAALAGLIVEQVDGTGSRPTLASSRAGEHAMPAHELRTALRAGVDWIAAAAIEWSVDDAVPALAAAGLAAHFAGASPRFELTLRSVVHDIDADGRERDVDWTSMGGDVVLAFADVLREVAIECTSLRSFLERLAASVRDAPDAAHAAPAAVRKLVALDLLPGPDPAASGAAAACAPPAGAEADEPPVELATRLVARTGGDPALLAGAEDEWRSTAERMAVALADACREYRLGEAAALLRALLVLGWERHRVVADAVDFLIRQQTLDGGFGYTASDDDRARVADQRRWTQGILVALAEFDRVTIPMTEPTAEHERSWRRVTT